MSLLPLSLAAPPAAQAFFYSSTYAHTFLPFTRGENAVILLVCAQGVVFAAKHRRTGAEVAIKRTHIGQFGSHAARASAFTEMEILSYIDHPNVVKLLGAYQCPSDIHTVLTKVTGFHMIKYLVVIDDEEAAGRPHRDIEAEKMRLLHQLVDAIAHVHSRREKERRNISCRQSRKSRPTPPVKVKRSARIQPFNLSTLTLTVRWRHYCSHTR